MGLGIAVLPGIDRQASFAIGRIETRYQLIAPGEVLGGGRYMLGGVLGRGATSRVHDGWDLQLSRRIAIKWFHRGVHALPTQITGRHVVGVHDIGEHDAVPYIVVERLPGVSSRSSSTACWTRLARRTASESCIETSSRATSC